MEAAERKRSLLGASGKPPHSRRATTQQPLADRDCRRRPEEAGVSSVSMPPVSPKTAPATQSTTSAWTTLSQETPTNSTDTVSPEIDVMSTASGATTWSLRVPWFMRKSEGSRYDVDVGSVLSFGGSDSSYYRDMVKEYDFMNMGEIVGHDDSDNRQVHNVPPTAASRKLHRDESERAMSLASQVTDSRSSVSASCDSMASFKESEWTPPDSSYGAACPICGWVPKKTRRMVEFTIIGLVIMTLVFLVVTTSIRITNDHKHGNDVDLDDDFYVEVNPYDDDVYQADSSDSNDEEEADENEDAYGDDGERLLQHLMLRKATTRTVQRLHRFPRFD